MVNGRAGVPSEGDLWTSNHILQGVDLWPEAQGAFWRSTVVAKLLPSALRLELSVLRCH